MNQINISINCADPSKRDRKKKRQAKSQEREKIYIEALFIGDTHGCISSNSKRPKSRINIFFPH